MNFASSTVVNVDNVTQATSTTSGAMIVDGGVGITQVTGGVKMTYPIAIDADGGSNPTGGTDYRIADGALWFDLS